MTETVLAYLRVLLSWPAVALALIFCFVFLFKHRLGGLIDRIATIEVGKAKLSTSSQISRDQEESALSPVSNPPLAPHAPELPSTLTLQPDEQKRLVEFIQAEQAHARLWEYRYLNFFLARHTQRVLDWLAALGKNTSRSLADSFWMQEIPDPRERQAVLDALLRHYLVDLQGELIEVTPKGRDYLAWRGPLPELPASTPPQKT